MYRILLVEDEPALQETLGESLRSRKYDVQSATDGEMAVNLAKSGKPDLILLDLILPKKYGLDVLKELREDETTENIPVIVLTNLEKVGEVERAIELGAATYLVKTNYSINEIIGKIEQVLSEQELKKNT
jgi:two-component system phosphate regulon response regulator PhoB